MALTNSSELVTLSQPVICMQQCWMPADFAVPYETKLRLALIFKIDSASISSLQRRQKAASWPQKHIGGPEK